MNFETESILAHTFSSICAIFISLCVVHGQYTDIQRKILKKTFSYSFKYRLLVSEVLPLLYILVLSLLLSMTWISLYCYLLIRLFLTLYNVGVNMLSFSSDNVMRIFIFTSRRRRRGKRRFCNLMSIRAPFEL